MRESDIEIEEDGLLNNFHEEKVSAWRKPRTYLIILVIVIVLLVVLVPTAIVLGNPNALLRTVKVRNIMDHLENLQKIANENGGNRAASTAGYNKSVDYVVGKLNKYKSYFTVSVQYFPYFNFIENSPPQFMLDGRALVNKVTFQNMRFSGSANITDAPVKSVGVGCTQNDWTDFPQDGTTVAIIARNDLIECNVRTKIELAVENKAIGVVMYNVQGNNGLFLSGLSTLQDIPIFAVGYDIGNELVNLDNGTVSMFSDNSEETRYTSNIIADTKSGKPENTITVGSHLDSVEAGPGINDNGSGSSVNLEIALLFAKLAYKPKNRVRFCWWGAEELGLLGSDFYVNSLSDEELRQIKLNLNFDMVGSPNYVIGVYDGASSSTQSGNIQKVFTSYLDDNKIPHIPAAFTGRSDYGPFLVKGIPAGGLFTGAEVVKTSSQYNTFGGVASVAYDPCYHLDCDTVDNVNQDVLLKLAKAAAHAIDVFAYAENLQDLLNNGQQ